MAIGRYRSIHESTLTIAPGAARVEESLHLAQHVSEINRRPDDDPSEDNSSSAATSLTRFRMTLATEEELPAVQSRGLRERAHDEALVQRAQNLVHRRGGPHAKEGRLLQCAEVAATALPPSLLRIFRTSRNVAAPTPSTRSRIR